jgi:hypothetical protein
LTTGFEDTAKVLVFAGYSAPMVDVILLDVSFDQEQT